MDLPKEQHSRNYVPTDRARNFKFNRLSKFGKGFAFGIQFAFSARTAKEGAERAKKDDGIKLKGHVFEVVKIEL